MMTPGNDDFSCPHCGGVLKKNAAACPHCGSDGETGWSSNAYLNGIDLPDDVSYEEILRHEFGDRVRHKGGTRRALFILIASILLAVMIAGTLLMLRP